MKLNIGCGGKYKEGWVNLEYDKELKADLYFDLNDIYDGKNLPFEDNTFDEIVMIHVLEHLPHPLPILKEIYRVCKTDGKILIEVPLGKWTWDILDHKREFRWNTFNLDSFGEGISYRDEEKKLELVKRELYLNPSRTLFHKIARILTRKFSLRVEYKKLGDVKERDTVEVEDE